jgi:alanine-glyoxylate transaminase/(R)-3-amino-2-methylpropionate-pyruvate transaminase
MTIASGTNKDTRTSEVISDHRDLLFPCAPPLYENPLVLTEGRGALVYDSESDEYLDFFSGILTTSLGHCHPEVVERAREQVGLLGHTSTLYLNECQVSAARRLNEIAPGRLGKSFFTNSGTEAVETAVMLACMYTGRSELIALRRAYSGRSFLATNITAHGGWRPLSSSIPGIKHVMSPDRYRSPLGEMDDETLLDVLARDLEEAIVTVMNGKPAAFMAETIQGVAGYVVPPPGYFQRMVEIIHAHGGLFICDEVQAGFGRTGSKWFAIEHWDVEPDIMVMAKGIANGFPVGATIAKPEIADAWTAKTISTYGGNAVCMAAMDTTLDVMVREDTPGRSEVRGRQLRAGLEDLLQRYTWIGDVRGMGLVQAMELVEDRGTKEPSAAKAQAMLEATKKEHLLVGIGGLYSNVIRLGPSMLVSEDEVTDCLDRLDRACQAVDAGR